MDEDKNIPEKSQTLVPKRRGRGRPRVCEQIRSSFRIPVWRSKFKVEEKWSLTEKTRLLEALRRYDPHNISNIAKLVGTRSEEEVEEKIQSLRGMDSRKGSHDRVDGPDAEKSPIETWIDLVQELTKHEPGDYSQFIPKVLGLITRNENFDDSGYSQLKWRNIYQFLADITEDRVEVQKLSDMESLVVLDMMHSVGDTLLKSDTSQQRLILDFKYNLLNFKSDNLLKWERERNVHRIAQALSNDFWDFEDVQDVPVDTPSSSASSSTIRSQSSLQQDENSSHIRNTTEINCESTAGMDSHDTQISSSQTLPGISNSVSHVVPGTSMSINLSTSSADADYQNSNGQTNEQHISCPENSSNENNLASAEKESKTNSGVSQENPDKFKHPKYLTLNPLCVPLQPLAFRPKTKNKS